MAEERGAASTLKGRLADVYVPALVAGSLHALSRRLGNRATIDDPLFGRASTLSSIDPLLEKVATRFGEQHATYRHVASATGVDRDVSEGLLVMNAGSNPASEIPIAVVAERRRLREIELRVYYATGAAQRNLGLAPQPPAEVGLQPALRRRPPLEGSEREVPIPQIVAHVLEAFRKGAVERVLAAFEESSRFVNPSGTAHSKRDGSMASFISDLGGRLTLVPAGVADDGRTCCIEAVLVRQGSFGSDAESAALSFERGDSGLLRELRLYYEP